MRQMVGHEMKSLPQRTPKNLVGDAAHLAEPQQESLLDPWILPPPIGAKARPSQFRIERIAHVIDVIGAEPGIVQAEADCLLGKLVRVVDVRQFSMLDAIKPLLLCGDNELAVDEQGHCGIVID